MTVALCAPRADGHGALAFFASGDAAADAGPLETHCTRAGRPARRD